MKKNNFTQLLPMTVGLSLLLSASTVLAGVQLPKEVIAALPGSSHKVEYMCFDFGPEATSVRTYIITTENQSGPRVVVGRDIPGKNQAEDVFQIMINKKANLLDERDKRLKTLPVLVVNDEGFQIGYITAKNTDLSLKIYRDTSLNGSYACQLKVPSLGIDLDVDKMLGVRPR